MQLWQSDVKPPCRPTNGFCFLTVACPPAADHVRCRQQPRYPLVSTLPAASSRCCSSKHSHDGPAASSLSLVESIGVKAVWLAGPGPGPGPEAGPRPGPGAQREAPFSLIPMPNAIERMYSQDERIPPSAVLAISGRRVSNTPRRGAYHDDSAAGSPSLRPDKWSA